MKPDEKPADDEPKLDPPPPPGPESEAPEVPEVPEAPEAPEAPEEPDTHGVGDTSIKEEEQKPRTYKQ